MNAPGSGRGYVRPSRAKPKTGWTLAQLAQLSGLTARAIRVYLDRGLLPRPRFKGPATRYDRTQLVWLLGIRRLRTTERLQLREIATRLRALSAPELEAFATAGLAEAPSNATAAALGILPVAPSVAKPEAMAAHEPRWARIELALGLELHLCDGASPHVLELARRVREMCAAEG
jgi:DNA-binding transcriptional MerR regulator